MTYVMIQDFGSAIKVAQHMAKSAARVYDAKPILDAISLEMIGVTDELWHVQGARGQSKWEALADSTAKRKGNSIILFTAGSDERYTPHPGDDILADSVTKVKGPHQILVVGKSTIEFGTDVEYANRQFRKRPFIHFTRGDVDRWARMILGFTTAPLRESTVTGIGTPTNVSAFGGGVMLRGAGGRFTGVVR